MAEIKRSTIIVPTDFTEEADTAIKHAIKISKVAVNDIKLLHVINNETKSKLKKEGKGENYLHDKLAGEVEKIKAAGVSASYELREGSIFSAIGDVAEEISAGLMVLGTHGVKGVQHIVGAFALKVVSDSPVPVIIVQSKDSDVDGYKKIVLPVDSYIEEKQKVFHVISVAKVFNAKIELFVSSESDEFLRKNIVGNTHFIQNQLDEAMIPYSTTEEDPKGPGFARQLIRYAAEIDADLITIMTEKGKDLKEFIVGPNNEKIINNDAQIPVMCVNPVDSHKYTQSVFTM